MSIQVLAPEVASKIAAGEVVERPANVVKELLENSLDAGATEIRVEAREGGRRLLRIIDNGHGIPEAELPLAFERHATSKLSTVDDLNHIATFGFRGEALFSIGAVSQVTLTSRHVSQPYGASVRSEGGVLHPPTRAGAPVGTTVNVEHLFFNVPARQKFLRAAATESGQIAAIIQHYALAYPERRFSFVNDGRLVFQSTGSGDLLDVLIMIYGRENAQQMVSLTGTVKSITAGLDNLALDVDFGGAPVSRPDAGAEREGVRVSGYVSLPSLTRANRSAIDLVCEPPLRRRSQPDARRGAGVSHAAAGRALSGGRRLCGDRPGAGRCERAPAEDAGALCRGTAHLCRRAKGGAPHDHQRGADPRPGR